MDEERIPMYHYTTQHQRRFKGASLDHKMANRSTGVGKASHGSGVMYRITTDV